MVVLLYSSRMGKCPFLISVPLGKLHFVAPVTVAMIRAVSVTMEI